MRKNSSLSGVFAAVVTPLNSNLLPDLDGLTNLLHFLSNRGCHGVLLMGTTGEGPSFSLNERLTVYESAVKASESIPDFQLLAGTGTPSLEETISLTHFAFDMGFTGVVVLPPYYYRTASVAGLYSWFSRLLEKAIPSDGVLLGYHIPPVSGVSLSLELLSRLKDSFPDQFAGIKDSSGDPEFARLIGKQFGDDLLVLNGNDRLFSLALQSHASGCITAMTNLLSPLHRQVWDKYQSGSMDEITQERLGHAREVLDRYQPMPPLIKLLLSRLHGFPHWEVKPPLLDTDPAQADIILSEFLAAVE